jgi:hypothetical protein
VRQINDRTTKQEKTLEVSVESERLLVGILERELSLCIFIHKQLLAELHQQTHKKLEWLQAIAG